MGLQCIMFSSWLFSLLIRRDVGRLPCLHSAGLLWLWMMSIIWTMTNDANTDHCQLVSTLHTYSYYILFTPLTGCRESGILQGPPDTELNRQYEQIKSTILNIDLSFSLKDWSSPSLSGDPLFSIPGSGCVVIILARRWAGGRAGQERAGECRGCWHLQLILGSVDSEASQHEHPDHHAEDAHCGQGTGRPDHQKIVSPLSCFSRLSS